MEKSVNKIKKQHKDTLFRMNFKVPENFLQLLRHCKNGDLELSVDDIEPFDLESAVTIRIRRNDVSFITKDNRLIILVEHQSSINPNMAFMLFLYYIELLQLWIKSNGINLFGEAKVDDFPKAEFYVAYNGSRAIDVEQSEFRLDYTDIKIYAKVNIVDIHFEKLDDVEPTNALAGYSFFYKVFDEGREAGLSIDEAFAKAREVCVAQGYLKGFIEKEEFVLNYKDILDYDTQLKEEGKIEGKTEGIYNQAKSTAIKMLLKNHPIEEVVYFTELTHEEVNSIKKNLPTT